MDKIDANLPNVCIIGAGLAGLCAAIQLRRKFDLQTFTVYESSDEVGGVWRANTYPGCACDFPSHLYSFSFAPKSDWSRQYAPQPEIMEYLKSLANHYDIYDHIEFKRKVKRLAWNEELGKWIILVANEETDDEKDKEYKMLYDIVICCTGSLSAPFIPSEFASFKGPIMHTAEWDHTIDLTSKNVAIVGSGASAVQLIPNIASQVGKLFAYQRSPTWVFPATFKMNFGAISKFAFGRIPGVRRLYRFMTFMVWDLGFAMVNKGLVGKLFRRCVTKFGESHIKGHTEDAPELRRMLVPNYPTICKQPLISNKYYKALQLPHVKVVTSKIAKVTSKSIVTEDGREEKIDVLILATGFRIYDYFYGMDVIGRNSEDIVAKWKKEGPSSYLGITSHSMPNLFVISGPGTFILSSQIFLMECQVHFVMKLIKKMIKMKANFVSVTQSAENECMAQTRKDMAKTLLESADCGKIFSWHRDVRGISTIYPRRSSSYWKITRKVDAGKFEFK